MNYLEGFIIKRSGLERQVKSMLVANTNLMFLPCPSCKMHNTLFFAGDERGLDCHNCEVIIPWKYIYPNNASTPIEYLLYYEG